MAQIVKYLPAMQWVQSLGQETPLKKGMATHSSVLAWRTPWTEEPGGYSPRDCTQPLDVSWSIRCSETPNPNSGTDHSLKILILVLVRRT